MPNAVYKIFDEFVRDCGRQNDWTDSTYEKFAAVKNHLMNFRDGYLRMISLTRRD